MFSVVRSAAQQALPPAFSLQLLGAPLCFPQNWNWTTPAVLITYLSTFRCFDFLVPKVEAMNRRLGSLVDEFKELVYPPDYNPMGKVTKRKQGEELGVDGQGFL
jgi:hypothetical protein